MFGSDFYSIPSFNYYQFPSSFSSPFFLVLFFKIFLHVYVCVVCICVCIHIGGGGYVCTCVPCMQSPVHVVDIGYPPQSFSTLFMDKFEDLMLNPELSSAIVASLPGDLLSLSPQCWHPGSPPYLPSFYMSAGICILVLTLEMWSHVIQPQTCYVWSRIPAPP